MKMIPRTEKGFTLVELMMAVAITLILTSLVVFNLLGELPSYRLRSTANKLAATLQYQKIRAVTTNRIAWLEVNYGTPGSHYYTGFVDEDISGTADAAEYEATGLNFPDIVGSKPCFKLPPNISFGFPEGFSSGTGPDGSPFPGGGNFITTYDAGGSSSGGFIGYRPTGVPVINPSANPHPTSPVPMVIYLTNILGEGYAVSVQITGRVRVWKWSPSGGGWI
ncbi:MAG: prepilin-type N-terminal cleavage/methylation domain-containing protein [Proteobacteria bacterium]|nr:prepilin-type N-terminal cleavage/methylation domain-containing protein [Pseudomonadota bacterium]